MLRVLADEYDAVLYDSVTEMPLPVPLLHGVGNLTPREVAELCAEELTAQGWLVMDGEQLTSVCRDVIARHTRET